MILSCFKSYYAEHIPMVTYAVVLDGRQIFETKDYWVGVACCLAWRKNNPREDSKRVSLKIKSGAL